MVTDGSRSLLECHSDQFFFLLVTTTGTNDTLKNHWILASKFIDFGQQAHQTANEMDDIVETWRH